MSTENKWYADLWIIKLLSSTLNYYWALTIIKKSMIHDPVNEVTTITIQTSEFIHVQLHLVAIFTAN